MFLEDIRAYLTVWNAFKYSVFAFVIFIFSKILIIIVHEIVSWVIVKQYSKYPGVATYYAPLLGLFKLLILDASQPNQLKRGNDYFETISDSKMVVFNSFAQSLGNVSVILHGSDAIQDFLKKEISCSRKFDGETVITGKSLENIIVSDGLNWRAVFKNFFMYEDLKLLNGPMYKILDQHIKEYVKTNNITNSEFKTIDLSQLLSLVMVDWIALVLFGYESAKPLEVSLVEYPELECLRIYGAFKYTKTINLVEICALWLTLTLKNVKDITNRIFSQIPYKLGLQPHYKAHKVIVDFLDKKLIEIYQKRLNETTDENSKALNIMDLMINHNKMCEKNGKKSDMWSDRTIVMSIRAFFAAGYETSLSASISSLMWMSQNNQDWISRIRDEKVSDIEEILQNHSLQISIQECLRLYSPARTSFIRVLFKDTEIQGVKFKKGTQVLVATSWNKWDTKFINAREFRPDRFEGEVQKLKRHDFIPFFEGKRKCIGHVLADYQMKFFLGYMMNAFELRVAKDYKIEMGGSGTTQCLNPTIEIKLR